MTLEAIGQKLKSARETQGLSLRQIYERTKIPINHLQSIDGGMNEDLPEPVYVAGFIKRYAECIGLDGQVLADEYRRSDEGNGNGNGSHGGGGNTGKSANQPVYITPEYLKHAKIDNRPPSYKLWPFYVVVIIVVIGVISWYSSQSNSNNTQDPNVLSLKDSVSNVAPNNSSGSTTAGTTGTSGTATGNTSLSPDKVVLSALKHVWVEVKRLGSGENIYTGFLEQGDSRTFDDPQGIRVTAGNGASLSVEFKGKIDTFGEAGKRSERTFSTETASVPYAQGTHGTIAPQGNPSSTGTTSSSSGSSSSTSTTTAPKPVKKTPKVTPRSTSDDGTRSIPGNDGMHSIDVPYRYSEGRLDAQ